MLVTLLDGGLCRADRVADALAVVRKAYKVRAIRTEKGWCVHSLLVTLLDGRVRANCVFHAYYAVARDKLMIWSIVSPSLKKDRLTALEGCLAIGSWEQIVMESVIKGGDSR